MQPTTADQQHECDLCHKTYRRRDLLVRHRRHCKPNKIVSKRKSCSACVQARSKCCLSQPTCSRCSERGLVCEYAAVPSRSSGSQSPGATITDLSHNRNFHDPVVRHSSDVSIDGLVSATLMSNPPWTPHVNDWASSNLGQTDSYFDLRTFSTLHPGANGTMQNPASQTTLPEWLVQQWDATLPSPTGQMLVSLAPVTPALSLPDHTTDGEVDMIGGLPSSSLSVADIIRILREYPASFSSDDYYTPLLHRELYGMPAAAITTLPKSTTAIMCALGLKDSSNSSFLKRAMTAERQRLVEGFPKYSCIEEWDTIHAMWLYEMMELPDAQEDVNDQWRPGPRAKGLNLPILLKVCAPIHRVISDTRTKSQQMTRRFCLSHPEATDPSAAMTSDTLVRYATAPSAWLTWLVGETSRRTVFLANIVNYFATKDAKTGEVSPYYEPLNDEMIWNMPLPCSSAAWKARTEQEWLSVLRKQNHISVTEGQPVLLSELSTHEPTVKSLITKFTKDHIRSQFAGKLGLEDTDSFRNLIVHCALEQHP